MKKKLGYIYILLATLLFVLNYSGLKYIFFHFDKLDPENASFWGFFGAGLLALPIYLVSKNSVNRLYKTIKQDGKILLLASFISSFAAFLWFLALRQTSVGSLALLVKTSVIFSILLGVFILKEKLSIWEILGISTTIIGMILISTLGKEINFFSVIMIVFSSFLFSLQSFFIKKYSPNIYGKEFAFLRILLMALLLGGVFLIQGKLTKISLPVFLFLSISVGSGALIGRALYFEAHKHLEISRLNIALFFEPILLLFVGKILFQELMPLQKIVGAILIFLGLIQIIQKDLRKKYTN